MRVGDDGGLVIPQGHDGGMRWALLSSPIGDLLIAADEHGLCKVSFDGGPGQVDGDLVKVDDEPVLREAADQVAAYFAGNSIEFTLPLSVRRGSAFERAVWTEMSRIPYGQTRTYGQMAAATGGADQGFGAARAVGVACNRNPLPIVVPCHRVVGAGSKLVGFGGGLDRKRFLLELEARVDLERALT
jgi:methylated-DNA-[protein]-cysteine S-methyltransferase